MTKARSKYREKLAAMIEEDTRHKRLEQEEFEQFVALVSHKQPRSSNITMKEYMDLEERVGEVWFDM